ncbi:MAG: carbon-nitrogen hydrolase family protein [Proteobacteria bacterium]|nr:carbon-nitrogen hydrolase family protein [Pseudomonadota bacterium]
MEKFIAEAAAEDADIVCFPETYLPGLRGQDFPVEDPHPGELLEARDAVSRWAAAHAIQVIIPMEWPSATGLLNLAFVISNTGDILGCQTKNQIAPEEDPFYVPGQTRSLFEIKGVPFGIVICHEGWRYPETVRWAAFGGARIVFHPTLTGGVTRGHAAQRWGAPDSPYYEKAMVCRSLENSIFLASVNCALPYQEAATAVITPDGECLANLAYGEPGVLIAEIDPNTADRLYASRFAPNAF